MNPNPQNLDIIAIVAQTYRRLWVERRYLIHVGLIPLAFIIANFVIVLLCFEDSTLLRRGLLLIPGTIAEAWLVAQFIRTLTTSERWPMPRVDPQKPISPARLARARALLSSMIFYVLIALGTNALAGIAAHVLPAMDGFEPKTAVSPEQHQQAGVMMIVFFALLINFRWLWLHIPFSAGIPLYHYVRMTKAWILNIQLAAIWITTIVPILLSTMFLLAAFEPLARGDGVVAFVVFLVLAVFNVTAQTVLALASSTAAAIALMPLMVTPPAK